MHLFTWLAVTPIGAVPASVAIDNDWDPLCSRDTPKGALRRDSKLWGNYSLHFWIWECLLLGAVPLKQLIMGPMVLPTPIFPVCPQHCHLRCSLCMVQSSVYNSVRKGRCRLPSDITSSQALYMYIS